MILKKQLRLSERNMQIANGGNFSHRSREASRTIMFNLLIFVTHLTVSYIIFVYVIMIGM